MSTLKKIYIISLLLTLLISCKKEDGPEQEAELFIPTAFTPDGDEVNDKFIVKGDNVDQYSIKIYDSENLLIYSSTDMNEGWDGNYKGGPMPAANYLWTIEYTDIFGKSSKRTGYVELIR